jgi:hypothetical protein
MKKEYDPNVRNFMINTAKMLRKGARSKDAGLMWAMLVNLENVLDSYVTPAEEQYLVSKLRQEIRDREREEQEFRKIER